MNYLENSELHNLYGEYDQLLEELKTAKAYSHPYYPNGDSKMERVQLIEEDIACVRSKIDDMLAVMEDYRDEEDVEQERTNLCISQGISRYC
jgi:hypothetical protein